MKDFRQFKKTLAKHLPLSENEFSLLLENAEIETIPKKKTLVSYGQISSKMYFILSGSMRLYYVNEKGVQRNCFFFYEGLFCTVFSSFMVQKPSEQYLETLEECTCFSLAFHYLDKIYDKVPKMNLIVRKILEERYINAHKIISSFILYNPERRYKEFIEKYPKLVNRIPEYHIASFIGISPKSFSRLKKRIHSNQKR